MPADPMTLWIPKDMDPASQTMNIAETMMRDFGVSRINNDTYNDKFNEYYEQNIKGVETTETFCSKNGTGINVQYLIDNADKKTYATLLSLDINPNDPTEVYVLASIVFKWSPTSRAVKIQAFCSNQKRQVKGAGTKLLNFLKKTLTRMGINDVYLNPVSGAIPYYSNQGFKKHPKGKVHDSSSPSPKASPKSKPKSKSKTKSLSKASPKSKSKPKTSPKSKPKTSPKSKPKSLSKASPKSKPKSLSKASPKAKPVSRSKNTKLGIPTMTINIRAANNWKKATNKIKSYQALTRKNHGKSHIPTSTKALLAKVKKIVDGLSRDHREIAEYRDIIDLLEKQGTRLNDVEKNIVRQHLEDEYEIY